MQPFPSRLRMVVIVALVALAALAALPIPPARATSAFADPAFQRQWQAGEAVTPNFWGPLGTARDGQQEAYDGAMRAVQYFDKGRMELTNGSVTNGLLATELLSGRLQTGTTTFENHSPSDAVMAGDQDTRYPGGGVPPPTYAVVSTVKELTQPTDTKVGAPRRPPCRPSAAALTLP